METHRICYCIKRREALKACTGSDNQSADCPGPSGIRCDAQWRDKEVVDFLCSIGNAGPKGLAESLIENRQVEGIEQKLHE